MDIVMNVSDADLCTFNQYYFDYQSQKNEPYRCRAERLKELALSKTLTFDDFDYWTLEMRFNVKKIEKKYYLLINGL